MSPQLLSILESVIIESSRLVDQHIHPNDLTDRVDYASIYARTMDEFNTYSIELRAVGKPINNDPTGSYFQLTQPLTLAGRFIQHSRVRLPDVDHPEKGYLDFEVKDYNQFKAKYLQQSGFSLLTHPDFELIELRSPEFSARAYFPSSLYQ